MAQASAFLTYDTVGNRESLMDVVTNITPHDTPLFSELKKVKVGATYHEWMIETLSTYNKDNTSIEGADFTYSKPTDRTRVGNWAQIFTKTWEVSGTQEAVDKAGVESEYARRMQNALKELATDVEAALMQGTGASGASGAGRDMKGLITFITTNVGTGTGTGDEALTENMYNDVLQDIWEAGGRPDVTFVGGKQKRVISKFTTPSQRQINVEGKKLIAAVDIYESEFGLQQIRLHRAVPADTVVVAEMDKLAVGVLREVKAERTPKIGDSHRGAAVGEFTLVNYNEAAHGKIVDLT